MKQGLRENLISESKSITELVADSVDRLKGVNNNEILIDTGFESLNNIFKGFVIGEYVVIGGRPGMGKTQLLIEMTLSISQKFPVFYASCDLSSYLITNRFISEVADIPVSYLLQQKFNESQSEYLDSIVAEFSKYKIFINDSFRNNIHAFRDHCKMMIEKEGVKVIIVDPIQMMGTSNYKRHERELEINYISGVLKSIARDFNVCVIASSELNRSVEWRDDYFKVPRLSDLRDSGALEQDADKVIFIYRPQYYNITEDERGNSVVGTTFLYVEKNSSGPLGIAKIVSDKGFSFSPNRLEEIDPDVYNNPENRLPY